MTQSRRLLLSRSAPLLSTEAPKREEPRSKPRWSSQDEAVLKEITATPSSWAAFEAMVRERLPNRSALNARMRAAKIGAPWQNADPPKRAVWTEEQKEILCREWSKGIEHLAALFPQRTKAAIRQQAKRSGLSKSGIKRVRWSEEDDQKIRTITANPCSLERFTALCKELLPNRTVRSIQVRAYRLRCPWRNDVGRKRWSRREDTILEQQWQANNLRTLRGYLPGRKASAILHRARRLGLPFGIPQGWIPLSDFATKTGFSMQETHERLKLVGCQQLRHLPTSTSRKRKRVFIEEDLETDDHGFDVDHVLLAFKRSLRFESTKSAAFRHRWSCERLEDALFQLGFSRPEKIEQHDRWYLDGNFLNAVVAGTARQWLLDGVDPLPDAYQKDKIAPVETHEACVA